jgi:hypothetical protein
MRTAAEWLRNNIMQLSILTIYLLLVGATMHVHAMWRDEMQAWLIARDSPNLKDLLNNLRYEGHPALWYLLLMPLTRLSRNPALMQHLQLAISAASLSIVLWRAPLTRLERGLFPFGYFILYEYAVKSRSYALGILLLVVFCALWPKRRQRPVLIGLVLALLANVHLLLLVLSVSAVFALALDRILGIGSMAEKAEADWRSNLAAIVVVMAGWSVAVATIRPPVGFAEAWYFSFSADRLSRCLSTLSALFAPAPSIWAIIAGGAVLLTIALRWKAAPAAALFFLMSAAGLLVLFYVKLPNHPWLLGILFLSFVATNWIARSDTRRRVPGIQPRQLIPSWLFLIVLAVQVAFGLQALRADWLHPLSNGRATARYIMAQGWTHEPIIGVPDYIMSPIVGYLGVDGFYYGNAQRWGSFTVWDQRRFSNKIAIDEVLQNATKFGPRETLVVGELTPLDPRLLSRYGFVEVASFSGAREPGENYDVYRRVAAEAPRRP